MSISYVRYLLGSGCDSVLFESGSVPTKAVNREMTMRHSGILSVSTGLALLVAGVQPAWASSHREAPNVTKMPKVDNTDVYAFRSYEPGRAGYVTLIANFQPFQDPGGGPNYFTMDPDAVYEIMVDNNGDAREDLTFQFRFNNSLRNGTGKTITAGGKTLPVSLRHLGAVTDQDDADLGEVENYTVTVVAGDRRTGTAQQVSSGGRLNFMKPFDNVGTKTTPSYPAYAQQFVYAVGLPNCSQVGKVFAGQRAEAFAVNLGPIFDLVNFVPIEGEGFPAESGKATATRASSASTIRAASRWKSRSRA